MSIGAGMLMANQAALAANSGGAPGGGTAGAAGPGFARYAPYLGIGTMLGGSIMDYIGQRQGAKSVQAEAERQAAEAALFNARRRKLLQAEIAAFDPQAETALSTGALLQAQRATAPAMRAGGRALGLSSGAATSANRALLPAQRMAAHRTAGGLERMAADERMQRLAMDTGDIDQEQALAEALYDQRLGVAGRKGGAWRLGGQLLQSSGMPLMSYAMNQPKAA
jgi:hypothetical protein